jgi:glucosamine--fructose-6-phosphate aminotransferase (isomerizing)
MLSPYEQDIQAVPEALRAFASHAPPVDLKKIDISSYDRIVLSGMGSSYLAAHPTWRRLVAQGHSAWWHTIPFLMDTPELMSGNTLLWLTSQSGQSGEIIALLDSRQRHGGPRTVLGFTNDASSALGQRSDVTFELRSGEEAAVATKSYANSLAANMRTLAVLEGKSDIPVVEMVLAAADDVEAFAVDLAVLAKRCLDVAHPRFALVAGQRLVASALFGGLILKEAAKVPAEGYVGGEFRHGPIELAGEGLTAILFGEADGDPSIGRLAEDLRRTGAIVVGVGSLPGSGGESVSLTSDQPLSELVCGAKFVQLLSVELAKAKGIGPGEFLFGAKITSVL